MNRINLKIIMKFHQNTQMRYAYVRLIISKSVKITFLSENHHIQYRKNQLKARIVGAYRFYA